MHKGRSYRYVVPYTMSKNWAFDSHPPYRVFAGFLFPFGGAEIENFPPVMSDPALRNLRTLENEWRGNFSIGFYDFRFAVNIQTQEHDPRNKLTMLLTDAFASLLLARWYLTEGTEYWPGGLHIIRAPDEVTATGFFGDSPIICNLDVVYYHQEP